MLKKTFKPTKSLTVVYFAAAAISLFNYILLLYISKNPDSKSGGLLFGFAFIGQFSLAIYYLKSNYLELSPDKLTLPLSGLRKPRIIVPEKIHNVAFEKNKIRIYFNDQKQCVIRKTMVDKIDRILLEEEIRNWLIRHKKL